MATYPDLPATALGRLDTARPDGGGPPPVVLTLGKLDGVHAGHRHLVARLIAEATARGAASAALVLHPDPATVLTGRRVPLLTTVGDRCARLRALGVDIVAPLEFTAEMSRLTPAAFLDRLARWYALRAIVVGPDFAFGHDRAGNLDTLRALGRVRGFDVVCVEPLVLAGARVSSRRIQSLIEGGDIAAARVLMGAPPRLRGTVIHGAARGRGLGFPTANLTLDADYVVPADGIYTVHATWGGAPEAGAVAVGVEGADDWGETQCDRGQSLDEPTAMPPSNWLDGVAALGVRPTFDGGPRSIEVYVLDFDGDLYGRRLTVDFLSWQRGEERFDSVDALVAQMHADVAVARANLAREAAGVK